MGDRCEVVIYVPTKNLEQFHKGITPGSAFNTEPSMEFGNDDGMTELHYEETNYAGNLGNDDDGLPRDVQYHGHHYEGDEYGPAVFACDGKGSLAYACSNNGVLNPVVEYREDGEPCQSDLEAARAYWAARKAVQA